MPPRKPPKPLSTSCTAVISNTVLDVIVQIEQTIVKNNSNLLTVAASNDQSDCYSVVTDSSDQLKKYYDMEYEIAKYILSNMPNALISLVILEMIKEFASRWYKIIQLSEHHANVQRNEGLVFR